MQKLPEPTAAWIDPRTGKLAPFAYQYLRDLDARVRQMDTRTTALEDHDGAQDATLANHEARITALEP